MEFWQAVSFVPVDELEFAQAFTAEERFAAARRWAGRRGLPRFLFAKTPAGWKRTNLIGVQSELTVASLVDAAVANSAPAIAQTTPAVQTPGSVSPATTTADE